MNRLAPAPCDAPATVRTALAALAVVNVAHLSPAAGHVALVALRAGHVGWADPVTMVRCAGLAGPPPRR